VDDVTLTRSHTGGRWFKSITVCQLLRGVSNFLVFVFWAGAKLVSWFLGGFWDKAWFNVHDQSRQRVLLGFFDMLCGKILQTVNKI
jgi:hypothetical protein